MKTRLILHTCPWLPAATLTCREKYRSLGCQPAAFTLVYYREHQAAFTLLQQRFRILVNLKFTDIDKSTALFSHECIHEMKIGPIN